jgi:hypothetical protein
VDNPVDNIAAVVIIALATWRLGHLLTQEAGPFHLLIRIRSWCGIVHDDDGQPESWTGNFAEGLMCDWCRGIWLASGLTLLWIFFPLAVIALAAAGTAIFAGQWFSKR